MKIIVLSSGSKGNTTYIESENTKILIDFGNTYKYVKDCLKKSDIDLNSIDAILLTHTHKDHIGGLEVALKHSNIMVFLTKKMLSDCNFIDNYKIISNDDFYVNDIRVEIIKTSHDASDSVGYIISENEKSIVYITDTGYINAKYFDKLKNKNLYIMESNYDVEMMNKSNYPFSLRKRIMSDKGHLSNYDSAKYLSFLTGDNTRYILLAHLSEENNRPDIALVETKKKINNDRIKIVITKQNEETEMIEI